MLKNDKVSRNSQIVEQSFIDLSSASKIKTFGWKRKMVERIWKSKTYNWWLKREDIGEQNSVCININKVELCRGENSQLWKIDFDENWKIEGKEQTS